jgi:hypothetical protein
LSGFALVRDCRFWFAGVCSMPPNPEGGYRA